MRISDWSSDVCSSDLVIERCPGHGGSWGVLKQHFETAIKVGRPAARQAAQAGKAYVASECPLAGQHLLQGIDRLQMENTPQVERSEERRVWKECVSTCRSRGSPYH